MFLLSDTSQWALNCVRQKKHVTLYLWAYILLWLDLTRLQFPTACEWIAIIISSLSLQMHCTGLFQLFVLTTMQSATACVKRFQLFPVRHECLEHLHWNSLPVHDTFNANSMILTAVLRRFFSLTLSLIFLVWVQHCLYFWDLSILLSVI